MCQSQVHVFQLLEFRKIQVQVLKYAKVKSPVCKSSVQVLEYAKLQSSVQILEYV